LSQIDEFEKYQDISDEQDVFKLALSGSFLPITAVICDTNSNSFSSLNDVIEPEHGFTLLHAAAYHSNRKAVSTFLKLGADPNKVDYMG